MSSVVALAEELISRKSITPHDGTCQDFIRDYLSKLGFQCESMPFGNVSNLYARYGNDLPLFVFAGHTDVVPQGEDADWESPPFKPTIRNGFLFGRGASDMKSAIAAMLVATKNFTATHKKIKGSIGFLITSDEEGEAINGTKKMLETLYARQEKITYCLIGEPSSDTNIGDQIRIGRRGSLHGKLNIIGKQGHVAHPHLAINPIHEALLALHTLSQTIWDEGNEHFPKTTFQITNIHSGTGATNVIPGHLDVLFNFRFSTAVTTQTLINRVEEILKHYHLHYKIEWKIGGEPFLTKHGKLITATQHAIKHVTGRDVKLSTGGGTSDGRFIAPLGVEVVELGVSHATAHHVNECVNIADLESLTHIYEEILHSILVSSS